MMSDSSSGAATERPSRSSPSLTQLGAAELARRIADGATSSVEACEAHIARIEACQPALNMMTRKRFAVALEEARAADDRRALDEAMPPLLGVPISVKECFDVAGLATNLGTTGAAEQPARESAQLVQRLCAAGAIVVAKTNIPQLMLYLESDNPRFGRTNNPWDVSRSCAGSSGGETVMCAIDGAALGVGSDMGGSLRVPAHACGVHAFKPTSRLLSTQGMAFALAGMTAIPNVPGFVAKHVEDLSIAFEVGRQEGSMATEQRYAGRGDQPLSGVRLAVWEDHEFFPVSPAIRRAVREAADTLVALGAERVSLPAPPLERLMSLFFSTLSADGGATVRRWLSGSQVDARLQTLLRLAMFPGFVRQAAVAGLRWQNKTHAALLLESAKKRNVHEYWQLCHELDQFRRQLLADWTAAAVDLALLPIAALAALPHGKANDLITASSYSILANIMDVPSGALSITTIGASEQTDRDPTGSPIMGLAARIERGTAGLPVAIQIMGRPHQDRLVLGAMSVMERHFASGDDYPPLRVYQPT